MSTRQQEALELFSKYGGWIAYIMIGLTGMFGWDVLNRRKLTFRYMLGATCLAIFIGFISSQWCLAHNAAYGPYVVPIATLMSRDFVLFLKMVDWIGVLKLLTNKNTKNK